jgi:hypothetical protein
MRSLRAYKHTSTAHGNACDVSKKRPQKRPIFLTTVHVALATNRTTNERYDKQNQENQKQNLGDAGSRTRNAAES